VLALTRAGETVEVLDVRARTITGLPR